MNSQEKKDRTTRKLTAIMFTDIVGYSRMMGENETLTINLIQEYENIVTPIIENHDGKILKRLGDGLFCEFSSALGAVDCAIQMQQALHSFNQSGQQNFLLTIRIGIHLGDVVIRGNDLYGDGVNVAARIEPIAPPGGICISEAIYSAISSHSKYQFVPLGKRSLKNIKQMHSLYLLRTGFEIEKTQEYKGRESILVGKVIDNYEIIKVLGHGGMGTVFKAVDLNLEKEVALKLMESRLSNDQEFINRFRTEGKSQALLQHPNIVTVHTLRGTDLGLFIVMEYVEGESLARRIQSSGAIPWQEALRIFKQIISAIEHAHSKGVIHRDIKPGNVMIDVTGKVKITDFGLARVQHSFGVTKTGYSGGTFVYSAPEQIKDFKKADTRSDIYSMGMTFYEVLAGKLPFDPTESDLSIQLKIIEGKIIPLDQVNPNVPEQLVRIVRKATDKEPDKRFQSAGEMFNALEDFEEKGLAHTEPAFKSGRKRINIPVIITLVLALFMLAVGYYFDFHKRFQELFASSVKTESTLKIHSEPPGALVLMDNNQIGETPIEHTMEESGDFNFRIEKDGYIVVDTTMGLEAGKSTSLSLMLQPILQVPDVEISKSERRVTAKEAGNEIAFGRVNVTSKPPGAEIWIDGKKMDNVLTPHSFENIEVGSHRILLVKDGFQNYSARIDVNSGSAANVHSELKKIVAGLKVSTDPPGASIWIDNAKMGNITTPATLSEIEPGEHSITLRKEGYRDFSSEINIRKNRFSVISETLVPLKGSVKVLVRPWGSIFIDGELKKKETNIAYEASLPVGSHQIRAVHPSLGQWEKQIEISSNRRQEYVIDFNLFHDLIITSEPNFCEIYVDEKTTGKYTPKQIKVRTGKHIINVRKEGFTSEEREININRTFEDPVHFVLKKSQ